MRYICFYLKYNCTQRGNKMTDEEQYYLVRGDALPGVFLKVMEVKELIAGGKAASAHEAASKIGISRSTFYRYKDSIFAYNGQEKTKNLTVMLTLEHREGVLSGCLSYISEHFGNVLTLNQNLPMDSVAAVSITMSVNRLNIPVTDFVEGFSELSGVVRVRVLY